MVLAWEKVVFVLLLFIFVYLFPGYFAMSPALHPRFSDPWRSLPALSSTRTTFHYLFLFIYHECYDFEWAFLPTWVFYLTLLPNILAHSWHFRRTCFIRVLLGAGSYFKVAELHTDPRNNHSNPQSSVHLNFVFMHISIAKVLLVVKNW